MRQPKHIAILGAGPGGYVAAIRAAQLGGRVTVVEHQMLGGVCLNWGCIPSKALLSVVELGDKTKKAAELGLKLDHPVGYDLARMVARKNKVVDSLVKGIATLFKTWGIEHVEGWGEALDARTLRVTSPDGAERRVEADALFQGTPRLPERQRLPGRGVASGPDSGRQRRQISPTCRRGASSGCGRTPAR